MNITINNTVQRILKKRYFWAVVYLGTYVGLTFCSFQADIYLERVLQEPTLRAQVTGFVDNVLRQVDSKSVFKCVDSYKNNPISDDQLYAYLLQHIGCTQPRIPLYSQFKALQFQKSILSKQALQLLASKKTIDNSVEIGTPATYLSVLKNSINITGKFYAVLDKQRISDQIQAHSYNPFKSFHAYDDYLPLSNYDPINENNIANNSIELIICFIGLHHVPQEKLDAYIQSLYRILKPGGILLLREHDAKDSDTHALIDAAHSLFNVIIGQVSLQENQQEIRNFKPLDSWIQLIESHGFKAKTEQFRQKGDPTHNTMIRFEKMPRTKKEYINCISQTIREKKEHTRALVKTFLTTPEWFNVDASQEYGNFINQIPFYEFPYFSYIATYWNLFCKSWHAASKRKGHISVLTSEHTLMNLFVGIFMTTEFAAKSLISLPVRLMCSGEEPTRISMLVEDPQQEVTSVDQRITILEKYAHNLCLIHVPRYKELLRLMSKIVDTNIAIIEIAGQREIQCKVRYKKDKKPEQIWDNCTCEYTWKVPTQPNYIYAALSVEVSRLKQLLKTIQSEEKIELLYLHDY